VTLSFANPHVAEKCRILAGMEPGKWYGVGGKVGPKQTTMQILVDMTLVARSRPSRYKRNFEYILTPAGEKMSALLRQIGAK
jgi:hypothetical protein